MLNECVLTKAESLKGIQGPAAMFVCKVYLKRFSAGVNFACLTISAHSPAASEVCVFLHNQMPAPVAVFAFHWIIPTAFQVNIFLLTLFLGFLIDERLEVAGHKEQRFIVRRGGFAQLLCCAYITNRACPR